MHRLSRDDARRLAVRAQLLDAERPGDLVEVIEQLGSIKIDPTALIAPAEQLIPWTRIGRAYEQGHLRKAVETDRTVFEFDGSFHAASLLPAMVSLMRHRTLRATAAQYVEANAAFRRDILARLRAEGPLTAADIPDTSVVQANDESGWYGSNQVPRMLELMAVCGEVAVAGRRGRQRVWDIPDRVWPHDVPEIPSEEAERILAERRLQAYGIVRRTSPWARVGDAGEPAEVEGSTWRWRVDPAALAALDDDPGGRAAILNPYDRMLFDRPRLAELFDFAYISEQFKPKAERLYGAFAHPILLGDRFVGLLDARLDKKKENLVVTAVHELLPFDDEERAMVDAEIRELADWLGVGWPRAAE
ncbi:DNA glycosylase AlkZ-like family protein [Microbacterium aurantiacum]|uniref:DNA glycosylase AlkZ-like family protein n=1 Tax=Microbacterium aurantiacum TaxID=162393 RepID=UPI001F3C3355|nr:crosslink repair DNA glycosylase YcaQ family protein [Microbacterium aurantiacum]